MRAAPMEAELAPAGAKWAAVPVLPQAAAPGSTAMAPPVLLPFRSLACR